jgi:HSP20 family protein
MAAAKGELVMALPLRRRDQPDDGVGAMQQLSGLSHGLTRWFDELWPDLDISDGFTPLADIEETDDAYLVDLELPGVKKGDIDVEMTDRQVVVSGERKDKERVGLLRRRTRSWGRFRFEVATPEPIDEEHIEATLADGVLHLRIPKAASTRRRQVKVS